VTLLVCGAACVGQLDGQGFAGGSGGGPSQTSGTGGTTGSGGKTPAGTGGSSSGSGGSADGSGGASSGSGGSLDGSGGTTSGSGGTTSGSGGSTSGSGGSMSGSGGSMSGSGGTMSGTGGATGGTGGSSCVPSSFPPDVQALLSMCSSCHGSTPLAGAPSLVTYANLTAKSTGYPSQTNAERALVRLQSTTNPMPPAGSPRPSATQVSALQTWVSAGYPMTTCPSGSGSGGVNGGGGMGAGGTAGAGGSGGNSGTGGSDPFAGPSVCTSKTMWTGGNNGSASMNPGKACIACHRMGEGPTFAVAGTLYPTAHEPDLCNGSNGSTTGARIVITDKNGKALTLTPNAVGNFSYQGSLATPFTASVTYMGRERRMVTPQTNGDCNSCHTTSGAMSAPGRILLP